MTKKLSQILPAFKNQVVTVDGQEIKDLEDINNIPISSLVFDSREVKKDKSKYFGPYTSAAAVKDTIELLNKLYRLKRSMKT